MSVLLKAAPLPVIDAEPPAHRRAGRDGRYQRMRALVGKERLDLKIVGGRDIHDDSQRGCAIDVESLHGEQFEEVASEAIAGEWRDLKTLSAQQRRMAEQTHQKRNRAHESRTPRSGAGLRSSHGLASEQTVVQTQVTCGVVPQAPAASRSRSVSDRA